MQEEKIECCERMAGVYFLVSFEGPGTLRTKGEKCCQQGTILSVSSKENWQAPEEKEERNEEKNFLPFLLLKSSV